MTCSTVNANLGGIIITQFVIVSKSNVNLKISLGDYEKMKNRFTLSAKAIFTSVLLTFFLFVSSAAFAEEYLSVSKDGVNIRSGPGTDQEILWEVFKGFPLQVLKRDDKWVQVKDFEGDTGWIYASLLSKEQTVIVKVDTANMRVGASKDYEILASVKYGVVFTPIEKEGDWVKVKHDDGTSGWIYIKLLWPEAF